MPSAQTTRPPLSADEQRRVVSRIAYREKLRTEPRLRFLFFELTDTCNLSCLHCGSDCEGTRHTMLDPAVVHDVLQEVAARLGTKGILVCITGGEPMLHPQFFDIMADIRDLGFNWGMTTNATCIGEKEAHRLVEAGLKSVSVSIDGTREVHDWFRRRTWAYDRAIEGIRNLNRLTPVEVITVANHRSYPTLPELYQTLVDLRVPAWRIVNVEPMGRALEHPEIMLTEDELVGLLDYVNQLRHDPEVKMIVSYGCSHYLGEEFEVDQRVRNWRFICGCGTTVASITCDGDIYGCLDVERRPELVQGNVIRGDSFVDAWLGKYEAFRQSRVGRSTICAGCEDKVICDADATHTWDFDRNEPRLCMRDVVRRVRACQRG